MTVFVWTIHDVLSIGVFLIVFIVWLAATGFRYLRQKTCSHARFWENRSCDAICTGCGKNLGFIGTVRDRREKEKTNA